jgi:ABC-2 type transport system permease protein
MIIETSPEQTRPIPGTRVGAGRRVASLARAEALLLRRDPLALLTAIATPIVMMLFVGNLLPTGAADGTGAAAGLVVAFVAFTLLAGVYYNLTASLVARREALVLKRLRTGELTDTDILAGAAVPAVTMAWGQVGVAAAAVAAIVGAGWPHNPVLVVVGLSLGTAVFVLLAMVTTIITRSVTMAQITTTPLLVASMLLSGLFPGDLPQTLQRIADLLPLTAVVQLLRLGLTGTTTTTGVHSDLAGTFTTAVVPLLILLAWTAAAAWVTRRWFRWEPRR